MACSKFIGQHLAFLARYKSATRFTQANFPAKLFIVVNQCPRNYAEIVCPPPKPKKRKPRRNYGKLILAAAILVGATTVGYAKYDPEFRKQVNEYLPFFDGLVSFIFCEEKSYWAKFKDALGIETTKKCPPAVLPNQEKKKLEKVKRKKKEEVEIVDCRIPKVTEEVREEVIEVEEKEEVVIEEEKKVEEVVEPVCVYIERKKEQTCKAEDLIEPPCAQKGK